MIKKVFLFLLLIIFLGLSFVFYFYNFSQAQNITPPQILREGGEKFVPKDPKAPIKTSDDIIYVIIKLFKIMAQIFWILAIAASFYAGYLYLLSGGNEEKTGKAKKMLLYAVIAIAIGLMAYGLPTLVYNFLNPENNPPQQPPTNKDNNIWI